MRSFDLGITKALLVVASSVLLCAFVMPFSASAAVISEQLDASQVVQLSSFTPVNHVNAVQFLGTGFSSVAHGFQIKFPALSNDAPDGSVVLYETPTSSFTSASDVAHWIFSGGYPHAGDTSFTHDFSSDYTMQSGKYYWLLVAGIGTYPSYNDVSGGGSSPQACFYSQDSMNPCNQFNLYYVLFDPGGLVPPYQDSHIISLSPSGFVSTTSPFAFDLQFYNGTTTPVLNACLQLYDTAIGGGNGSLWRSACSSLSFLSNQNISFSQFFSAYPTGNWALHAQLISDSGSTIDATTTYFTISSDSSGFQNFVPSESYSSTTGFNVPDFVSATVGTSSVASTTAFLSYLNIPHLLSTKAPFAYIFSISSILLDSFSTTSPASIPSGVITWTWASGTPAEHTFDFDFFSTSTVTHFMSPDLISLIRSFLVAVIYFETGYLLYREARRKHLL